MGSKKFKMMGGIAVLALLLSTSANAHLSIQISDTADFSGTVISASDTDGDGVVNINSGLGTWGVNVVTGLGDPALGSDIMDEFDLNSVNVSGGTGTIYIRLTDTGLTRLASHFNSGFGGTTDGSVSFQAYVDATNSHYGKGTLLSDSGSITGGAFGEFSGGDYGNISMTGPYSLSIYASITHGSGFNVSSFDYNIKVPEPTPIALLGLGLLGITLLVKNRQKQ